MSVQVALNSKNIIINAFSLQTACGSGKPKAVWVIKAKVLTGFQDL